MYTWYAEAHPVVSLVMLSIPRLDETESVLAATSETNCLGMH